MVTRNQLERCKLIRGIVQKFCCSFASTHNVVHFFLYNMATLHEPVTERNRAGGAKLLSEGIKELAKTNRYAYNPASSTSRHGLHSRSASFPQRTSKSPFFVRHNPHPKRVVHLKGLLDVPVCTVIDDNSHEDPGRFFVRTPTIPTDDPRMMRGLRVPMNSQHFVACKEKAVPGIGLGMYVVLLISFFGGSKNIGIADPRS